RPVLLYADAAIDERDRDAVLDTDHGFAFGLDHRTVRQIAHQRIAADIDLRDAISRDVAAAQVETGVDHRMDDDTRRVGLEGVAIELPALAEFLGDRAVFRLRRHHGAITELAFEALRRRIEILLRIGGGKQAVLRGVADANALRHETAGLHHAGR